MVIVWIYVWKKWESVLIFEVQSPVNHDKLMKSINGIFAPRKRTRSDSVLCRKLLYQKEIQKPIDNRKTTQTFGLHNDCGLT